MIDVPLQYITENHIRPCAEKCSLCMKACSTGSLEAPYMMCKIPAFPVCQDVCSYNKNAWKNEEEFPNLEEWSKDLTYSKIVLSDYSWLKSVFQLALDRR